MKRIFTTLIILVSLTVSAQVKIGDNPTSIDANSLLELESTDKGLLIPRVALTATNNVAPLAAHTAGMLVYNTATSGTAPNNVTPGFYYNNGTAWNRIISGSAGTSGNIYTADGTLSGNRTVTQGTNTLAFTSTATNGFSVDGSTFSIDAVNNRVGMGTTSPQWPLHIIGNTLWQAPSFPTDSKNLLLMSNGLGSGVFKFSARNDDFTVKNDFLVMDLITGNMGVGISAPTARLEVSGTLPGTSGFKFTRLDSSIAPTATGVASIGVNATGDVVNVPDFYTNNGTLSGNRTITQGINTLAFTSTASTGTSHFTVDGTTLNVDAVNNRVGVGTTTPAQVLDVNGTIKGTLLTNGSTNVTIGDLGLYNQSSGMWNRYVTNSADHRFFTDGSAGNSFAGTTPTLTIAATGNIGIDTTSPGSKLEINSGTANTSGLKFTNLNSSTPVTTPGFATLGVNASGNIVTVPSGDFATQTIQNMTSSRSLGTTYTNSTGRPIIVMYGVIANSVARTNQEAIVNGNIKVAQCASYGGDPGTGMTFIVPAGSTYYISSHGGVTSYFWTEWR